MRKGARETAANRRRIAWVLAGNGRLVFVLTSSQLRNRAKFAYSLASAPIKLSFAKPDRSVEELVQFAVSEYAIRSVQLPWELRKFAELVKSVCPKGVLEIGTCMGGTLLVLCRTAHPEATVISVDLPGAANGDPHSGFSRPLFRLFKKAKQSLHLLREDSHLPETRDRVRAILAANESIDLLFIDGDHSYKGVKADFDLYAPLVRKGGIVAFHDIAFHRFRERDRCFVDVFWNEIKSGYRHEEIIENANQGWAGIGILYMT